MVKNGIYKHFKGGEVLVFATANTPEDSIDVLYQGLQNGKIYARPLESFCDEVKNADGEIVQRFKLVQEMENLNLVEFLNVEKQRER